MQSISHLVVQHLHYSLPDGEHDAVQSFLLTLWVQGGASPPVQIRPLVSPPGHLEHGEGIHAGDDRVEFGRQVGRDDLPVSQDEGVANRKFP